MEQKDIVLFEADGEVAGSSATIRQCQVIPLSLKALQAYLEREEYNIGMAVQGNKNLDNFVDEICSYQPRIIAATASACEFPITAETIRRVKNKIDVVSIVGGYHASAYPQSLNPDECPQDTNPEAIDFLCVGEGELTLTELVDSVRNGSLESDKKNIKGLAYFEGGRLHINQSRKLIDNLDSLPRIEWTPKELEENIFDGLISRRDPENSNVVAIISEKGCVYACEFCSTQNVYGKIVRTRSIESLADEIENLVRNHGVDMIADYAPTANRDGRRVHALAREIRKRGLQQTFSLYNLWRLESPDGKLMITDDLLRDITKTFVGFKAGIGIEALTEEDEIYISKRHSLNNLISASSSFDKHGAIFRGFFMITPETTKDAIDSCINSQSLGLFDDLRVTYLTPYPGTVLYEREKGNLVTENWGDFTGQQPVLKSNHLTDKEYASAAKDIIQGFLLNLHRLERVREKLRKFPALESGMERYHEKNESYGYEVLKH